MGGCFCTDCTGSRRQIESTSIPKVLEIYVTDAITLFPISAAVPCHAPKEVVLLTQTMKKSADLIPVMV